jgi:CheY-like chemotaxis protein
VMAKIFEPFYTTKELGKGTGLGLSMVFGFMKQSGGHINVYSEPGIGTTFRLYLPRSRDDLDEAEPSQEMEAPRAGGESILVVEDNAQLRRVVVRQLGALGYRVVEAGDASAALTALESERVDLLFTDIVMPGGISGLMLAGTAKERWPAVKVILTSGFPETNLTGRFGAPAHGVPIMSKPYRGDELACAIRKALDS